MKPDFNIIRNTQGTGNTYSLLRTLISLCFFFAFGWELPAQPVNNLLGDVVMPSPEAASLGKHTDVPVGYYTGVPSIGVPIHTAKDGSLSLPVSLSYHASGAKVGEPASWVGMGWSLNAGGRVMRTVMGLPDENYNGYFYTGDDVQVIPDMSAFNPLPPGSAANVAVHQVHEGVIDGEADIFSFNFAGYTGKFYFGLDGKPVLVPKQNIDIELHLLGTSNESDRIQGFTFTTPDGNKYHFGMAPSGQQGVVEKTQVPGKNPIASGWMLVKVESFDGKNSIELNYEVEEYSYKSLGGCSSESATQGCSGSRENEFNIRTYRLSSITYPFGAMVFTVDENLRVDLGLLEGGNASLGAKPLVGITVNEGGGKMCKVFRFDYDYWEDETAYATGGPEDKRLKLLSVEESSCDGMEGPLAHTFEYYGGGGSLPHRLSLAIDHWGYYNGADENNSP